MDESQIPDLLPSGGESSTLGKEEYLPTVWVDEAGKDVEEAPPFPVPPVLGSLQNTNADLETLAGKALSIVEILVEEKNADLSLVTKENRKEEKDREEKEVVEDMKRGTEKQVEEEKEAADNKFFADLNGFFNPNSRKLQVSCVCSLYCIVFGDIKFVFFFTRSLSISLSLSLPCCLAFSHSRSHFL